MIEVQRGRKKSTKVRNLTETIENFLLQLSYPKTQYSVMCDLRNSFVQTKKHILILTNGGFLRITDENKYVITEKGNQFLKMLQDYNHGVKE